MNWYKRMGWLLNRERGDFYVISYVCFRQYIVKAKNKLLYFYIKKLPREGTVIIPVTNNLSVPSTSGPICIPHCPLHGSYKGPSKLLQVN